MVCELSRDIEEFFSHANSNQKFRNDLWVSNDSVCSSHLINHWHTNIRPCLEQRSNSDSIRCDELKIPEVIHFVWLGLNPLPRFPSVCNDDDHGLSSDDWNEAMITWKKHHPSWKIYLWRDSHVMDLWNRFQVNQSSNVCRLYLDAMNAHNYGMASDIVRIMILYHVGGVYVDIDYICHSSVQTLHEQFDFYCGASNVGGVEINNGIIACTRRHWFLKHILEDIIQVNTNPISISNVSSLILDFLQDSNHLNWQDVQNNTRYLSPMDVIEKTGPGMFTRSILNLFSSDQFDEGKMKRFAVLPSKYFHPVPNHQRFTYSHNGCDKATTFMGWIPFATHLWSCSWQ